MLPLKKMVLGEGARLASLLLMVSVDLAIDLLMLWGQNFRHLIVG
jgi:hypothetical protein